MVGDDGDDDDDDDDDDCDVVTFSHFPQVLPVVSLRWSPTKEAVTKCISEARQCHTSPKGKRY